MKYTLLPTAKSLQIVMVIIPNLIPYFNAILALVVGLVCAREEKYGSGDTYRGRTVLTMYCVAQITLFTIGNLIGTSRIIDYMPLTTKILIVLMSYFYDMRILALCIVGSIGMFSFGYWLLDVRLLWFKKAKA